MFQAKRFCTVCTLLLTAASLPCVVTAQSPQDATVQSATNVLNEIMAVPAKSIPQSMLADLRRHDPPIMARVADGCVLFDVRTVRDEEFQLIAAAVLAAHSR